MLLPVNSIGLWVTSVETWELTEWWICGYMPCSLGSWTSAEVSKILVPGLKQPKPMGKQVKNKNSLTSSLVSFLCLVSWTLDDFVPGTKLVWLENIWMKSQKNNHWGLWMPKVLNYPWDQPTWTKILQHLVRINNQLHNCGENSSSSTKIWNRRLIIAPT